MTIFRSGVSLGLASGGLARKFPLKIEVLRPPPTPTMRCSAALLVITWNRRRTRGKKTQPQREDACFGARFAAVLVAQNQNQHNEPAKRTSCDLKSQTATRQDRYAVMSCSFRVCASPHLYVRRVYTAASRQDFHPLLWWWYCESGLSALVVGVWAKIWRTTTTNGCW